MEENKELHQKGLNFVKNKGGACELFINGFCTDLSPKEEGCVGKNECNRFQQDTSTSIHDLKKKLLLCKNIEEVHNIIQDI